MDIKRDAVTVATGIANGAASAIKTAVLRLHRLPDQEVDERLAICKCCPGGHVVLKRNGMPHSCGPLLAGGGAKTGRPCGCLIRRKARDAKQSCPFGYWPETEMNAGQDLAVAIEEPAPRSPMASKASAFLDSGPTTTSEKTISGRIRRFLDVAEVRERKSRKRGLLLAGDAIAKASQQIDKIVEVSSPPGHNRITTIQDTPHKTSPPLYEFFDEVFVVNLDRRPDRLARLNQHLGEIGWPFRHPQRIRAVDGNFVKPPKWWRAGPHAWGCHQSHLQIMERALMDGLNSILILEDDVFFMESFRDQIASFLYEVPDDWQQIYLGGQHLYQKQQLPIRISENVLIPHNVNRTHAFALHRRGILHVYQWLTDYVTHSRTPNHHIDHRLGVLHGSGSLRVYAPVQWLAGQFESHSNIKCQTVPTRLWNGHEYSDHTELFVAIIGLHRSGSSSLAGAVHKLGVHMGDRLGGYESSGGFEAVGLSRLCEQAFPFPSTTLTMPSGLLRHQLSRHVRHVQKSARDRGKIAGGKYPHLCAMGEDLKAVCGDGLRCIHINRPIEESIASLVTRSRTMTGRLAASDQQVREVQQWLWKEKQEFLKHNTHLQVEYHDLLASPGKQIDRIARFLGLKPTRRERQAAIDHIRPAFARHTNLRSH